MSLVKPRYYRIDEHHIKCFWDGISWVAIHKTTQEPVTRITSEGTRYIATGFPGKKWATIEQAIAYTLTMRRSGQ